MFEDFVNSVQNFRHNKTRTILSLLGVIIGVASVIIISTIGSSATENIKNSYGSSGLDLLEVYTNGYHPSEQTMTFNEQLRADLMNAIPEIKDIFYINMMSGSSGNGVLQRSGLEAGSNAAAVDIDYLEKSGFVLDYGSWFTASDDYHGVQKVILGSEVASVLFPEGDAIGKAVTLNAGGTRFGCEVTGVLKSQSSMPLERPDLGVYLPRGFYKKRTEPDPVASRIIVQAASYETAAVVQKRIEQYAAEKTGEENSVYIFSMQTMLDQFNTVIGTVSLLLSGVAAISLLVGGIGIMNIMIVTVTERKREIGIRKALGATPGAIRSQFLVESAAITLTGGLLGIAAGLILSYIIVLFAKWTYIVDWPACIVAFAFSACIGVFFGLNPALRAAKLDPVNALAGE